MSPEEIARDEAQHRETMERCAGVRLIADDSTRPRPLGRIVIREPGHFSSRGEECYEMTRVRRFKKVRHADPERMRILRDRARNI